MDHDIGRFISLLPEEIYLSIWFDGLANGHMDREKQLVAQNAALHVNTSTSTYFDSLRRVFLSIEDNEDDGKYSTRFILDIQDNQMSVIDPKDRIMI